MTIIEHFRFPAFALLALISVADVGWAQEPRWPAPKITAENFSEWRTFIQPSENDLRWKKIRWHKELADAAIEAEKLQRPILLFTMNGHPCGET